MREIETYDTELAHNMWFDGCVVWIAHPSEPDVTYHVTEAEEFAEAKKSTLYVIEVVEELA